MAIAASKHSKVKSKSSPAFAVGGSGHMFGKQTVGTKTPGATGKVQANGGGKFAKGGTTKMLKEQHTVKQRPGITSKH